MGSYKQEHITLKPEFLFLFGKCMTDVVTARFKTRCVFGGATGDENIISEFIPTWQRPRKKNGRKC